MCCWRTVREMIVPSSGANVFLVMPDESVLVGVRTGASWFVSLAWTMWQAKWLQTGGCVLLYMVMGSSSMA